MKKRILFHSCFQKLSHIKCIELLASNNSSGGRDFPRRRSFCCFIYFTNAEYIVFIVRS